MSGRAFRALLRKDLVLEVRGREVVPAMAVFVLAAFVLFRFGLSRYLASPLYQGEDSG